ncbi:flagellar protein FliO/FliZ [Pseudobutyrivibrio sp. OR37]|uniref:flagellar biosynthetic protein FliO n=1 Tax=Pseudobutyrivibrio sp. OR37 TaxID=1798186 RepID=UPI0008DF0309|nr:flagellar biosynthetic protein FliO [Pseudobutyrivibrio sp. OR37]SFH62937.1 flagellar protein FliO/FliZ [Pseudobutyrivibrio sp. OR37]
MILLSSAGESFFQLIFALVVFVGILALTTFVTKWIAGYQKSVGLNKNLEIVEAIRLSNNKFVQIIRAGEDKYFVVAIGKDEVTLLGELSSSQLKDIDEPTETIQAVDFKTVLEKLSIKQK